MALSLLLFLSLLAATASARPCKTLFYFSSATTTTFYPQSSQFRNPNFPNSIFQFQNHPRHFTLILTTTTEFHNRASLNFNSIPTVHRDSNSDSSSSSSVMTSFDFPLKLYSPVSSSIRDRTKDIMSVVGALLFGVACGALTSATMYFFWALFSTRSFDLDDVSSDDEDTDDDVAAAKRKLGYVAIPADPKTVDAVDDLKKPAPVAKEVL